MDCSNYLITNIDCRVSNGLQQTPMTVSQWLSVTAGQLATWMSNATQQIHDRGGGLRGGLHGQEARVMKHHHDPLIG